MKKICKNIIIIIGILSLSILMLSNKSYASGYDNFKSFNDSPTKTFKVESNKLSDITVKIKAKEKIASVKLYKVDSKGNKTRTSFTNKDQSNKTEYIYKMSHSEMLKGKTTHFYLELKSGTGNIFNSEYIVKVKNKKVNGQNVKCYVIEDAPKAINWNISGNTVSFTAKDSIAIKSLKIQDMNNGNKTIKTYTNLPAGGKKVTFDTSKCKTNNNVYKIKIIEENKNKLKMTKTVFFIKKQEINTNTSNKVSASIKLDRTVLMLDKEHYNVATLKATVIPSNTANNKISWSSSKQDIAIVDAKGNITAKKAGTTTITATNSNGQTAKCNLKVIGHMTEVSENTPGAVASQGGTRKTWLDKYNKIGYWQVKKEKFSKEQIESYVNNAEILCKTENYNKYPESAAAKIPVYKNGTEGKTYINKKQGLSANNYLILATTTNQKIYIFKKQNGKWNKIKENDISSGWYRKGGHNRFDFYVGAIYENIYENKEQTRIHYFWQCNKDAKSNNKLQYTKKIEPYDSHRSLHEGDIFKNNGAPSSSGCVHISNDILTYIIKNKSNFLGTRIIVY